MKKKLMIFLMATFLTLSLVGCSVPEDTETNNSGMKIEINSYCNAYEFVDPDTGVTGVHYLCLYKGGMTPRLNSDGSIMCDK